jgi:MFS family permease
MQSSVKNLQYYKFSAYGFLKNLRFFEAFLILYLLEKGMSYSQIGIMYAVREVALNLLEIPSGLMADTWGRKRTLAGSFLFYIASFLVFYFSSKFVPLLLAFALFGLADAFRTGTHKGMMMDYLKMKGWDQYKTAYYGHTRAWSQRGMALSSLAGGIIVFYSGNFQSIFLYATIPYLINLLLLLSYPNELNYSSETPDRKKNREQLINTFKNFRVVLRRPAVLTLISNSALHSSFQKSVKDYIQPVMVAAIATLPFLTQLNTKERNGLFIGSIYFIIYLFTSGASRMAGIVKQNRQGRAANTTLLAGLLAGLICGLLFNSEFWWFALVAFALIYIVENFRKPIMTALVADEVPNKILASVLSAQSQLKTVYAVIISLLLGFLADRLGIGIALTVISAGIGLLFLGLQLYRKIKLSNGNS